MDDQLYRPNNLSAPEVVHMAAYRKDSFREEYSSQYDVPDTPELMQAEKRVLQRAQLREASYADDIANLRLSKRDYSVSNNSDGENEKQDDEDQNQGDGQDDEFQ